MVTIDKNFCNCRLDFWKILNNLILLYNVGIASFLSAWFLHEPQNL